MKQQPPFAYQMGSLLLSRDRPNNSFKAPLNFIICIYSQRHEAVIERRGWHMFQRELYLLLGFQDASLMAENMVIATESLEMGSFWAAFLFALVKSLSDQEKE